MSANRLIQVPSGSLTINGVISGAFTLTKSNNSMLILTGNNTFTGAPTISGGPVTIRNSGALGTGTKTVAINNGTAGQPNLHLDGSGGNLTLPATLSFSCSRVPYTIYNDAGDNVINGNFTLTSGGGDTGCSVDGGTLTLGGSFAPNTTARNLVLGGAANGTVLGPINDAASPNFLAGVKKQDAGTWTLKGTNLYTGITLVSAGKLILTGNCTITNSSAVTVAAGAVLDVSTVATTFTRNAGKSLEGSGVVTGSVVMASAAILRPGGAGAVGTLSFSNDLTLASTTTNYFDLGASTTPGVGNDLVVVAGNLTVSGAPIIISSVNALVVPGTYRLYNYRGSKTGSFGTVTAADTRYTMTLDESVPGQVNVIVSGSNSNLVWSGGSNGAWNVKTSANWNNNTAAFYQSDAVTFNDTTTSNTVNLTTTVLPSTVTIAGSSNYVLSGVGKISGNTSLTKTGNGNLTISTTNDFTGVTTINGGTVIVGSTNALGTTNGITVVNPGGTLDLNARILAAEQINFAGTGATGNGAVVNNGADQQNALQFVTLGGNASGGGTGRWDVRGAGGSGSFSGRFDLNGNTFAKVGASRVGIIDSTATNAGSLVISNGLMSITRSLVDGPGLIDVMTNTLYFENCAVGYVLKPIQSSGGKIQLTGNAFQLGSAVTSLAGVTFDNTLDLTLTNSVSGAGGLTKVSAGNLILQGPALHFGPTMVVGGTMTLGPTTFLTNSSSITVSNNATLDASQSGGFTLNGSAGQILAGGGYINGQVNAPAGSSINPGMSAGTLTLNSGLALDNAGGVFELGASPFTAGANDQVVVNGNGLTVNGVTTIKVIPLATLDNANPYTLFQNNGPALPSGSEANFNIISDSRYSFVVLPTDNYSGSQVNVQVTGSGTPAQLVWRGNNATHPTWWDNKATVNWLNGAAPDKFFAGDTTVFDDSASGTTAEMIGTLQPSQMVFSNAIQAITLSGAGSLNAGSLTASGTGLATIANSAGNTFALGLTQNSGTLTFNNAGVNNFGSGVVVNGGVLNIANPAVNSFGSLTLAGGNVNILSSVAQSFGAINFAGASTLTFDQPANVTVGSVISGSPGLIVKANTNVLTLSGANAGYTGAIQVNTGTLRAGNAAALGDTSGITTIASGAVLDVNAQNLGNEPVTVSGSGLGSTGAVVNLSGTGQNNALHDVTLAGDTTFGGIGRWDIRYNGTGNANLITGGSPFGITKVGANQISLVSVNVDSGLGNVDVQAGILSWELATTSFGDPTMTLTVESNATFQMWAAANPLDKLIVLNGGSRFYAGSGTANTVNGAVTLQPGTENLDVASAVTVLFNNAVSGPGNLNKITAGTATLAGTNTIGGNVTCLAGTLNLMSDTTIAGNLVVDGGSILLAGSNNISGSISNFNGTLTLSNSLAVGTGKTIVTRYTTAIAAGFGSRLSLRGGITTPADVVADFTSSTNGGDFRTSISSDTGANTWSGPIHLNGTDIVGFYAGTATPLTINGPIEGTNGFNSTAFFRGAAGFCGTVNGRCNFPLGAMNITDNSVWTFAAANNVWDRSLVAYGRVICGADNALPPAAPLTLGQPGTSTGTLDLNGHSQEVAALFTLNGLNHFIGSSSTTADSLFVFNGTNVSTYAAKIVDSVSGGTMKVAVNVKGGTLILDGANGYTGPTLVKNSAVLGGNGSTLSPVTVEAGGTLSVGSGIGSMGITNTLTFLPGSTNFVEVNTTTGTNDNIVGLTTVNYGGTLVINNLGAAPITLSSTFKLFTAASYGTTDFAAISPATPAAGLVWDTSTLKTDGTLRIASGAAPSIGSVATLPDGNFRLTINGALGQAYSVRASTNLTLAPIATTWTLLSNGTVPSVPFTFDDLTATNYPVRFYIISTP